MTAKDPKAIRIAPKKQGSTLSAAQKRFNNLIKQIDKNKKLLLDWKDTIPVYQQKVGQEYEPLFDTFNGYRLEWLQLLDQYYEHPLFKKTDKAKIKHIISAVCDDLVVDMESEAVKALFNKYKDTDYYAMVQEQEQAMAEMIKGLAKEMFKVDIDDDVDVSTPEKFQAHLQDKLREQAEAEEAVKAAKPKKKTVKQLAREAKQQEDEALAGKSVQEIYRKLVAALHPDREPDEQERARKTELMQRVNTAYGKKDLLQLLELQLEAEQVDAAQLGHIADDRLKHFNKILGEQLAELTEEIGHIEMTFMERLNMPFFGKITPKHLLAELAHDMRQVKQDIAYIKEDLQDHADPATFKAWLKAYRIPKPKRRDAFDELFGGDPFDFR
ncbi:J domain-containing protein [Methylovulum psychrotolerans]|uniref:J domain-containing protein n=1 Tax=Methylovulum psychrotolerans TaxID=1704499 RepID=A0A2S5CJ37_9GAMM|nr:J domain-containing protein [Methylovulum psychrotolerans]POZ50828.1 J domain-containing protein [Methylovulum psychrotolerans]